MEIFQSLFPRLLVFLYRWEVLKSLQVSLACLGRARARVCVCVCTEKEPLYEPRRKGDAEENYGKNGRGEHAKGETEEE